MSLLYLYINDFASDCLNRKCEPVTLHEKQINCLLYADDLILLSESQQGLQQCMDELSKFNQEWNLGINFDKTEILIFNKSGKFLKTQITYNGINVRSSKK